MHVTFDNDEEIEGTGGTYLPAGTHVVEVTKAKDKQSSKGNPMTVLTLVDSQGRSCLEHLAVKWKFAALGRALGMNNALIKAEGVNTDYAVGRTLTIIRAADGTKYTGTDGKQYDNLGNKFVDAESQAQPTTAMQDDIPDF